MADLIAGLGAQAGQLGAARKALERLDAEAPTEAPLPAVVRDRQTRKAGYQEAKRDLTKWQPIVTVCATQDVLLMGAYDCLCTLLLSPRTTHALSKLPPRWPRQIAKPPRCALKTAATRRPT